MVRNVTKTTKRELSWLEDGQAAAGGLVDGEMRSGKVVVRVSLCVSTAKVASFTTKGAHADPDKVG